MKSRWTEPRPPFAVELRCGGSAPLSSASPHRVNKKPRRRRIAPLVRAGVEKLRIRPSRQRKFDPERTANDTANPQRDYRRPAEKVCSRLPTDIQFPIGPTAVPSNSFHPVRRASGGFTAVARRVAW